MAEKKRRRITVRYALHRLRHIKASTVVILLLLTIVAAVSILPIIYIISNAFKPLSELFLYPPRLFVRSPTLQNFYEFFYSTDVSAIPLSRYIFNSLFVMIVTVAMTLIFSSACAYAFSKMRFPGRKWMFDMIIIALMFTPEAVVITRYLIVSNLHMINTYFAHILPHLALPIGVFLMKQFIDQVPDSLCEAAKIDGANEVRILLNIIIPTVLPAVGAVMIIAFQNVWSDITTSTFYMVDESMKTLPYFVSTLSNALAVASVARKGAVAAAGLLLFLPNFLIFAMLQKSMIETMVTSGIK
ncbi:MAG: carbohydrate ABC transporter permease [Clostridiales bacterium]|nr:carbohydrate ABC transporter permease [Clostridiales bacterium]